MFPVAHNTIEDQGPARLTDAPIVLEAEVVEGEVKSSPSHPVSELQEIRAEEYLAMVESGVTPTEAAKELGLTLKDIKQDPIIQASAKQLIQNYRFNAADRRELTRAKLNQILIQGDNKEALAAAKQIAEDPEVNISGKTQPGNQVNIGIFSNDTLSVLDKLPGMAEKDE